MAMRVAFPPSSQKVDVSAMLGIPPENSWISELRRLEKRRYKKLRANQEVLIFNK